MSHPRLKDWIYSAIALATLTLAVVVTLVVDNDAEIDQAHADRIMLRDEFGVVSYGNNDGTAAWAGDWIEINDDGDSSRGEIRIEGGMLQLGQKDGGIRRGADLSDSRSVTLSFKYRGEGFSSVGEYVALELSTDGGRTWLERARLDAPTAEAKLRVVSYDISAFASSSMMIRFIFSSGGSSEPAQSLFVDDVQIVAEPSNLTASTTPALAK